MLVNQVVFSERKLYSKDNVDRVRGGEQTRRSGLLRELKNKELSLKIAGVRLPFFSLLLMT